MNNKKDIISFFSVETLVKIVTEWQFKKSQVKISLNKVIENIVFLFLIL